MRIDSSLLTIRTMFAPSITVVVSIALLTSLLTGQFTKEARAQTAGECANGVAVQEPLHNQALVADCNTLLVLRDDLLGGTGSLNWSPDISIDEWKGILLDGDPRRVSHIELTSSELGGHIPEELSDLSGLRVLRLDGNKLTGRIPAGLAKLSKLVSLNLSGNRLEGDVPGILGELSSLQYLHLGSNRLSGKIPGELGNLRNLKELYLGGNQLSGVVPVELSNLDGLRHLSLSDNRLRGLIPVELSRLSNLYSLSLFRNELTGPIPGELGRIAGLRELRLGENYLTGNIPVELTKLSNLQYLKLGMNNLEGEIPAGLSSLFGLRELHLDRNNGLTGEIPAGLAELSNLESLYLHINDLTGEIPRGFEELPELREILLGGNRLEGCVPGELRNVRNNDLDDMGLLFCDSVGLTLQLCLEPLTGPVTTGRWRDECDSKNMPGGLANFYPFTLSSVMYVNINLESSANADVYIIEGTDKDGEVLASSSVYGSESESPRVGQRLGPGHYLVEVVTGSEGAAVEFALSVEAVNRGDDFERAALTAFYEATDGNNWQNNTNWLTDAPLDEWRGVTTNSSGRVTRLELSSNSLRGNIPSELGNLSGLVAIRLDANFLTGEIPSELGLLTRLGQLELDGNQLSGEIPQEFRNLSNLRWLNLAYNQLTGPISPALGDLSELRHLHLGDNQLSGAIPLELSNLSNLISLHLFGNQLAGEIPSELGRLADLKELSLNANRLSGPLPSSLSELKLLRWLTYENNEGLCSPVDAAFQEWLESLEYVQHDVCAHAPEGTDREALASIFNVTGAHAWDRWEGWNTDTPLGQWYGVDTDNRGNVQQLALEANGLTGPIPFEIGSLTDLRRLSLQNNHLSGAIPGQLGNLANLEYLNLRENMLRGVIPPELSRLTNLKELYLAGNQLVGCVPESLHGVLLDIEELGLPSCGEAGPLPGNALGIPGCYEPLPHEQPVVALWNADCKSSAQTPRGEDRIARYYSIRVETETIVVATLRAVHDTNLYLRSDSGTNGAIVSRLPEASRPDSGLSQIVSNVGPGDYTIEVTAPAGTSGEFTLSVRVVVGEQLEERAALTALFDATDGDNWNRNDYWLTDAQLLHWYGVSTENFDRVIGINLSDNRLSGEIPRGLLRLSLLQSLDLSNNRLTGEIPLELSHLLLLAKVNLDDNELTGDVPHVLSNLTHLQELSLAGNQLGGCVPDSSRGVLRDNQEVGLPFCEFAPGLDGSIPISDTFGTFANPVPLGTIALAPDGVAIEVSSPDLDANDVAVSWEIFPRSGADDSDIDDVRHVLVHVRAQNVSGDQYDHFLGEFDFGLTNASGDTIGQKCEWAPGDFSDYSKNRLDRGASMGGIICFKVPAEEVPAALQYLPAPRGHLARTKPLGFWSLSDEYELPPVEGGDAISKTYGTRNNPVPFGKRALTDSGYAIEVLSVELDADETLRKWHRDQGGYGEYAPPASGNRFVVIRARASNVEGSRHPEYNDSSGILKLLTSSGRLLYQAWNPKCASMPDRLGGIQTFEGGSLEGNLCFEVPDDETGLTLVYENGWQPRKVLGFWQVSESPVTLDTVDPSTLKSSMESTRANPISAGEKALAPDGIAVTVLSVNLDAAEFIRNQFPEHQREPETRVGLDSGGYRPPARGNRYISIRVRIEGLSLIENTIEAVKWENFGVVTSSGLIVNGSPYRECGSLHQELYVQVFNGANEEAELCFEIPSDATGISLYYTPKNSSEVLGFWAITDDRTAPEQLVQPMNISGSFGSQADPVPIGERAVADNGVAISVLSHLPDLSLVSAFPADTHKFIVVRFRVEDVGGDEKTLRAIGANDFLVVGSSGEISPDHGQYFCPSFYTLDLDLYGYIFKEGWQELDVCFRIPVDDMGLSIAYKPEGSERILGYWKIADLPPPPPQEASVADRSLIERIWDFVGSFLMALLNFSCETTAPGGSEPQDPVYQDPEELPGAISDSYGTLAAPVPLGRDALASNGVSITVLSLEPAADDIVMSEDGFEHHPPAPGNRYVFVRVRAENQTGYDRGLVQIGNGDFGLLTASGLVIAWGSHMTVRCEVFPERLEVKFLGDDKHEGNLCFQVPDDDAVQSLFYAPRYSGKVLGFWSIGGEESAPSVKSGGKEIDENFGTRHKPVPIGERALISTGAAISILSVNTDPGDSVRPVRQHTPPEQGAGYILISARVEGAELTGDSLVRLDRSDFGIVSSSGEVIFRDGIYGREPKCETTSRSIHESLVVGGGFVEGDLCFEVPSGESGWALFYDPGDTGTALGFWKLTEGMPDANEVQAPSPGAISESFGSWYSPVPLGETARVRRGLAITVLATPSEEEFMQSLSEDFFPPSSGRQYIAAKVRIENIAERADNLITVSHHDFGVVASPGKIITSKYRECGTDARTDMITRYTSPEILEKVDLFRGGSYEGFICFQVPLDDAAQSVFYSPGWKFGHLSGIDRPVEGFWLLLQENEPPEPVDPATPISNIFGTPGNPVPVGERAVASNGVAVTVVSAELNANRMVEARSAHNEPPEDGSRYVIVRVRVRNEGGGIDRTVKVASNDFGIATPSGTFRQINPCGAIPDLLELILFGGMENEGNLCFELPLESEQLTLIYKPGQRTVFDERARRHVFGPPEVTTLGFWSVPKE